jgi:hypothetical protein
MRAVVEYIDVILGMTEENVAETILNQIEWMATYVKKKKAFSLKPNWRWVRESTKIHCKKVMCELIVDKLTCVISLARYNVNV